MKKIAFFVEGQTEQLFLIELLQQIVANRNMIVCTKKVCGKLNSRKIVNLNVKSISSATEYYIIIYDCGGDHSVKSDILERVNFLEGASFSHIIGIRDVYPETNYAMLEKGLSYNLPIGGIPISIILAVMEIESWFLAEENHYRNISMLLTIKKINAVIGLDIKNASTEVIPHPAFTLNQVYRVAVRKYNKNKKIVTRTIKALDYRNLVNNVAGKNTSLNKLLSVIYQSIA
jgi:hypothetical protein